MRKYRIPAVLMAGVMASGLLYGCSDSARTAQTPAASQAEPAEESRTEQTLPPPEIGTEMMNAPNADMLADYDEEDLDVAWNPDEVTGIVCEGEQITVEGDGAETSGSVVTVRSAGTYVLSGNLADGQVVVDAGVDDVVRLVLNGVELSNSQSAPIYGVQSRKIIVTVEPGTENKISDTAEYIYEDPEQDEPDAAIFSNHALVFNGIGNLSVNGNYACGIRSKRDLTVISGNLTITSQSDALKGKDSVAVLDGNIQITSGKDGIKANNDEEADKGYVRIDGGQITITAKDDGIQAESKATVNGGQITITDSQEGIEGLSVDINGGVIDIVAQDDGINAAANVETEQEKMMDQDGVYIRITGGEITIDAGADGIDSNGDLYIEGGTLLISGPTSGAEGILDYNGEASITGGVVLAAGNSGMMQTFGEASTQPYLVVYYEEDQAAGTELSLQDESGGILVSFVPVRGYNTVIASAPTLEEGQTYSVVAGEASTVLTVSRIETSSGTPRGRGSNDFGGPRDGRGEHDGQMRRSDAPAGATGSFPDRPADGGRRGTPEGTRPERAPSDGEWPENTQSKTE